LVERGAARKGEGCVGEEKAQESMKV